MADNRDVAHRGRVHARMRSSAGLGAASVAVLLVLPASTCSDGEQADAPIASPANVTEVEHSDAPIASPADGEVVQSSVSISSPADGAVVDSPFEVVMAAEDFIIEPAGDVRNGAGHFHLMVDTACVATGDAIPDDGAHLRIADGSSETELALGAGEHSLCLQAGDGEHAALDITDEITITVTGGEPTEPVDDTVETAAGSERWEGTYLGDVIWDCGTFQGAGLLDGFFEIEVDDDRIATLTGANFITGSCAGNEGQLGTEITIEGERTTDGFEFPADLWQLSDPIVIEVTGVVGTGGVTGPAPSAISITLDFEVVCLEC